VLEIPVAVFHVFQLMFFQFIQCFSIDALSNHLEKY